jgi:hypothetical protein
MRKLSFYLGILLLCLAIFSRCGKLERKGTPAANVAPRVQFVNTPPESTQFSINPRVYWFGTDEDGFITAYQYAVMVTDSVVSFGGLDQVKSFLHDISPDSGSWTDQVALRNMVGVHVQSEPGGHSRNVAMYAEMDPSVYTPQYLFLRAVDNAGDVSDEIIHRLFYRNNHRPEAFIDVDSAFAADNHYCLDDTTVTWKGISIPWSGLDTADYPDVRDQPDFQFKWELVGPFDSPPTALTVDTMAVVDSSLDSTVFAGELVYTRWVSHRSHVFSGMKNFEDAGADAGYGWYQLRVRARDDAYVSTDTATTLNFRVVRPMFRYADAPKRTILVVDASTYGGVAGGADTSMDVRTFYDEALTYLLSVPGLCDDALFWWDPDKFEKEPGKSAPGEDMLSRYDLTLVLNFGSQPSITDENFRAYRRYLNVGGRLWLCGLNNFRLPAGRKQPHRLEEIKSAFPNAYQLGTEYFGLTEVFVPTWTVSDSMTLEVIGAEPYGLWDELPTLEVDTLPCTKLKGYLEKNEPVRHFGLRGIPYLCYIGISNNYDSEFRIPAERRMYSVVSYYGSISPMHDRACAANYIGPTYRTAEFCFPFHLMKNEAPDYPMFKVMEETVKWFWEDLPQP